MKLSEAIRLGALLHPQTFGATRKYAVIRNEIVGTCAIGAAREAGYSREFSWEVTGRCPACEHNTTTWALPNLMAHLNDFHRWTRERIADWVETVEPDETTDAQSTTDDVRGGLEETGAPVLTLRAS